MRAVAALAIVVYHVYLYGGPGGSSAPLGPAVKVTDALQAGVTLFFVLSGFLLFRPYVASIIRGAPLPRLRAYLVNRALRILPAYWTVLLVVALLFEHELLRRPSQFLANAFLAQTYVPSFINGAGIVPSWSLTVEVIFYLLVPVLGVVMAVLVGRAGVRPLAAAFVPVGLLIGTGVVAKIAVYHSGKALADVLQATFPAHADWFAVGMTLAILRVLWEDGRFAFPRWWSLGAPLLGAAVGIASLELYYHGALSSVEVQSPIALALGLWASLVFIPAPQSRLVSFLEWRPLAVAGLGSYSIFLWHDPLLRVLRDHGATVSGTAGFFANLLLVLAVAGSCSFLSYRLIEVPALARKRAWEGEAARPVDAEPLGSLEDRDVEAPATNLAGRIAERVHALPAAAQAGIDVSIDPRLEQTPAFDQLDLIVESLLANAVSYGSPPISLKAWNDDNGRIVLKVEDRGRGVSPEFVPHLFEPGMRSERSRAERSGEGYGLSRAREAARALGGAIQYEPALPTGAVFRVLLPYDVPAGEHDGGVQREPHPAFDLGLTTLGVT
jgi:peptidoglycan/LPS O-acetylase OafA/YrhL